MDPWGDQAPIELTLTAPWISGLKGALAAGGLRLLRSSGEASEPERLFAEPALAVPLVHGDVLVSVGDGKIHQFSPDGTMIGVLDTGLAGATTGMEIHDDLLWVTAFGAGTVVRFNMAGTYLGAFGGPYGSSPESIVFEEDGDYWVGHADGDADLRRYNSAGTLQQQLDAAVDARGTDWIELSADGCTLYYTSEGGRILRIDVCTGLQLPDLDDVGSGEAFEIERAAERGRSGGPDTGHPPLQPDGLASGGLRRSGPGQLVRSDPRPG